MGIEDSPILLSQKPRVKPNRLCVLILLVCFSITMVTYRYMNINSRKRKSLQHLTEKNVNQQNLLNRTLSSNLDNIVQNDILNIDKGEISVKDLLENGSESPVRFTRSEYTVKEQKKHRLTSLDEIKPSVNNIFFIESRCGIDKEHERRLTDNKVVFNARQVCAIESTAMMNPSRPIYILHTCPLDANFYENSPKYFQELLSYPNVHVVYLKMADLFIRSSVEDLYFTGKFEASNYPIAHISDVMRLLALWKFGGTYMDIDVVSIRPIDDLGINWSGWQDWDTVATGVMNFADTGFGHSFLTKYLEALKNGYDPHNWSTNGPLLITRLLREICNLNNPESTSKNFTAYPIPILYPVYYTEWRAFFDENESSKTLNRLNQTYVVHIWNKMSSEEVVHVGSKQAYAILADKYCPKAYHNCGNTF